MATPPPHDELAVQESHWPNFGKAIVVFRTKKMLAKVHASKSLAMSSINSLSMNIYSDIGNKCNIKCFDRVYIDNKHKFLYNRVRKNANSTIMIFFYTYYFNKALDHDENKIHSAKEGFPSLSNSFFFQDIREWRRMLILRNPHQRVLSAFLDKFRPGSRQSRRFGSFERNAAGFAEFLAWLKDGGLGKDSHWDLQGKMLAFPFDFYTDIIDFDNLNSDFPKFLKSVGMDSSFFDDHANKNAALMHSTDSKRNMEYFYNNELRKIVHDLYEYDFALYDRLSGAQTK